MRVTAIRDSYFSEGNRLLHQALHKGSTYNVMGKFFVGGPCMYADLGKYPKGHWVYQLLELPGFHHEDYFTEATDDLEDELIQENIKEESNV